MTPAEAIAKLRELSYLPTSIHLELADLATALGDALGESSTVVDLGVWAVGQTGYLCRPYNHEPLFLGDDTDELVAPHLKSHTRYRVHAIVEEVRDGE